MPVSADSRILDNIVRSMQNSEDDPLTPLIDEYLLKRKLPKYANKRLKSITLDLEERPRPGGRLSPSSVCGCERQAAFKFLGVEGKARVDPDQELIFEDGHWRHHKWQTIFLDMEAVLGRNRFRVVCIEEPTITNSLYIAGHLDAEIKIKVNGKWRRYVIDIKGANNFAFEKTYRDRTPNPTYVKQLISYMKARKCRRGILLFDSKNTNVYYCFMFLMNDKDWGEVSLWCKSVIGYLEDQKLPPRHPDCDNGTFLYNRCPYRAKCFGKTPDRVIQREVYVNFPGVEALWEEGHALVEAHGG